MINVDFAKSAVKKRGFREIDISQSHRNRPKKPMDFYDPGEEITEEKLSPKTVRITVELRLGVSH